MRQRADVMKLAVENGIHDLDTIRSAYNEFAKGGNLYPDGGGLSDDDIEKKVLKKEEEYNSKLVKPINIGYDKDRAFTLTNAGSLTGAHLSEEMTDYLIQEAEKAGVDMVTAFGIPAAESTLGNPTDDRSAWSISSGIRKDFNNVYPGTSQFINFSGDAVNEQDLVNFWGPLENQNPYTQQLEEAQRRAKRGEDYTTALKEGMAYADRLAKRPVHTGSITQQAYEYFKEHGEAYNPSYRRQTGKSYVQHVKEKGNEALQSPEIKQAINNYALRKIVPDKIDYTPEWRKPYSNSKKYVPAWKKSFGGNLYPDGGYVRSTNDHPVAFDSEGNLVDQVTGETGTMRFPEILLTADPDDVARGRAQRWYKDFGIESNDATSVAGGRRQNSHLDERSAEGAAKAAGWAKDHPVLNTVGLGLGAAPFAVAAYPGAVVGGELLPVYITK